MEPFGLGVCRVEPGPFVESSVHVIGERRGRVDRCSEQGLEDGRVVPVDQCHRHVMHGSSVEPGAHGIEQVPYQVVLISNLHCTIVRCADSAHNSTSLSAGPHQHIGAARTQNGRSMRPLVVLVSSWLST